VEFEKGNGMVKPELLEERIFNSITWAPRLWGKLADRDWKRTYSKNCRETGCGLIHGLPSLRNLRMFLYMPLYKDNHCRTDFLT
jgi:hypothetical protein